MAKKLDVVNLLSQAHGSLSYTVALFAIGIWFGWIFFPIVITVSLLFGIIERKFINKRVTTVNNLAVVVTGCSSGIGKTLALSLASQDVQVFATVRKESDAETLKSESSKPDNIIPIIADVTNHQQLQKAAADVKAQLSQSGKKLLALVNNAGYGYYAPVEVASIAKTKAMYEVNVFGMMAATQVFTPLLREFGSKTPSPRVINISSGAGKLTISPSGTYCSSKFAVEALSDALRAELKPWGIQMIVVEPGRFFTEFQDKAYVDLQVEGIGATSDEVNNHYIAAVRKTNEYSANTKRPPVERCVEIIEDALFDSKPLARYLAGRDVQAGLPLFHQIGHESIHDFALARGFRSLLSK